ncbi:YodC family protein [Halomonas sp. THAF12]|uniref:YodC family protein n=1 Tax=Halomonas sp. THAF12 TaxID=2587849 RepID=UPI0012697F9A|nr:DUF2158 domain-containing protein [Halomonas sp. THAF12]
MADQFVVGDIVKLRSGGPEMTVRSVSGDEPVGYTCQWFAGKKLENGYFPHDSLEKVDKEQ